MTVFCTYCSSKKNSSQDELPSIQRYKSDRIKSVYDAADKLGLKYFILSGKYGLIEPDYPIPFYDYLLQSSHVPEHSKKTADQLKAFGVKDIIFFGRSIMDDENVKPYYDCIKLACKKAEVNLKFVELQNSDP